MRSDMINLIIGLMLCTSSFYGCTERLPLTPVYSSDADWTPAITLYQNGYQRVELLIDRPTRKELWRNISFLTLQARKSTNPLYDDIDSVGGSFVAPTESYGMVFPAYFLSKPRLEFGADYTLRIAAHFGVGEIRYSNELAARTPQSIGKVLKRIRPKEDFYYPANLALSFYRGSLLLLRFGEVIRIDTATGQYAWLKYDFQPPYDRANGLSAFAVVGDTSYSFYWEGGDDSNARLVSLDLKTLRVDSSRTISTPGKALATMVSHRGELYGFWWDATGIKQSGIINPRTGEVVRWFSQTPSFIESVGEISSDGTNIFYSRTRDFDNRIVAIDPTTMTVLGENRNPVFSTACLTWDGTNFWVLDLETQSYAKLKLEGI